MTQSINNTFDRDLYLYRVATKKPLSEYEAQQNFCNLFRQAGIELMIRDNNIAYYSQRYQDGLGI